MALAKKPNTIARQLWKLPIVQMIGFDAPEAPAPTQVSFAPQSLLAEEGKSGAGTDHAKATLTFATNLCSTPESAHQTCLFDVLLDLAALTLRIAPLISSALIIDQFSVMMEIADNRSNNVLVEVNVSMGLRDAPMDIAI